MYAACASSTVPRGCHVGLFQFNCKRAPRLCMTFSSDNFVWECATSTAAAARRPHARYMQSVNMKPSTDEVKHTYDICCFGSPGYLPPSPHCLPPAATTDGAAPIGEARCSLEINNLAHKHPELRRTDGSTKPWTTNGGQKSNTRGRHGVPMAGFCT